MSPSRRSFETLRPTTPQAAAMNASLLRAVMLPGGGKRSRKAKNQSLRLLWRKRSISGKKTVDLGEVEGQVVGQDAVEHLGLGFRDRLMGLRDLLDVVEAGRERGHGSAAW